VVYIGIKSGVYRDCWDCPFLGGVSKDPWRRPEIEEPAEEDEQTDLAAAAALPKVAASASSGGPQPGAALEADGGQVRRGNEEIAALRKRCKNTLFVAGAVLSTDGLQDLTRLLTVFCHPPQPPQLARRGTQSSRICPQVLL